MEKYKSKQKGLGKGKKSPLCKLHSGCAGHIVGLGNCFLRVFSYD